MAIVNLKELKPGKEIEIPNFYGESDMITVLCKRPSILSLAANGTLPNSLLASAQKIFTESVDDSVSFKDIGDIMHSIAKSALLEPTYDEFLAAGFELTDDQIAYIFSFVQGGVKELEKFRNKPTSPENNQPSPVLQEVTI